jgi:hypothetical protein
MTESKTSLTVNATPVKLTDYPRQFLTQTVLAAVSTLKKVGEISEMEVSVAGGKSAVTVNGQKIPLGPFPSRVIASTLNGFVSVLKGVDQVIESFQITVG